MWKRFQPRWPRSQSMSAKLIDTAAKFGDAGTSDLYTGISRETDKLLWFVESHGIGK